MLTDNMKALIADFSAGAVATINPDGSPSVSPKATFVVLNDKTLAFGNIRSPNTVRNIEGNPVIEVCFTDILARRAVRVSGTAVNVLKEDASPALVGAYSAPWAPYLDHVTSFVVISVTAAEVITSPAYDVGFTEDDLRATNLQKLHDIQPIKGASA